MTKLTKDDVKLLIKLYKMKDTQLHDYLYEVLRKTYGKKHIVRKRGKFLVAVGSKIGLVAHLDVYGKIPPKNIVYNKEYITAIDSILGADDRTGVFIILKMLELGFKPTIIFTHDEEIGCKGASAFTMEYKNLGVNYLIQLDRRGDGVVFYDNDNQEFISYILSFRNKEEFGSFSDISILCPECNVSGCNLGVGYHNEHTKGEYQDLKSLSNAIDVTLKLLQDEDNSKYYEYQEAETVGGNYPYGYDYGYGAYNNKNGDSGNGSINLAEKEIYYNGEWLSYEEYYKVVYGYGWDDETVGVDGIEDLEDKDVPF